MINKNYIEIYLRNELCFAILLGKDMIFSVLSVYLQSQLV